MTHGKLHYLAERRIESTSKASTSFLFEGFDGGIIKTSMTRRSDIIIYRKIVGNGIVL